jgi:hypothetical protein
VSPNIIRIIKLRRMRWVRACSTHGGIMNAYRILVRKPEGKRPLGGAGHIWEDNIKMNLRDIGWDDMDWLDLAHDRTGGGLSLTRQ